MNDINNRVELKFSGGKTLFFWWDPKTGTLRAELFAGDQWRASLVMDNREDLEDVLNPLLLTALTAWRSLYPDRRKHRCPVCG